MRKRGAPGRGEGPGGRYFLRGGREAHPKGERWMMRGTVESDQRGGGECVRE